VFAIRVAAFIISLLLVTGSVETEDGWFIALAVLTGLSLFGWWAMPPRLYFRWPFRDTGRRRLRWQDEW
jgi:hypothetical protein